MIDPFIMQLFIVPAIVIGIGVAVSVRLKRIYIAPITTLVLNLLYETWYSLYYYPNEGFIYTTWNVIFPVIAFAIALVIEASRSESETKEK